jgi:hypothetical protein
MNPFRFLVRNSGGSFMAKEQQQIEAIRDRLAEAIRDRDAIRDRLRDRSIEFALSDDPHAAAGLAADEAVAQQRVEQLQLALGVAEEAEAQRLAGLRDKEHAARQRARQQHNAELMRNAATIAEKIAELQSAVDTMSATAGKITALLPPSARGVAAGVESQLTPVRLRMLIDAEEYRVSLGSATERAHVPMPPGVQDERTSLVRPLVATIAATVEILKRHTEAGSGQLRTLGGVADATSPRANATPLIAKPSRNALTGVAGGPWEGELLDAPVAGPEIENVTVAPALETA